MTIRGRAGFATWFSRVSPEERGISVAWRGRRTADARPTHGRRAAASASSWPGMRGKRGAGGLLLAVILRNRRERHHCVYLTADIADKYTQSFGPHRRRDPGSARWVAIGIVLHLRHPKFTSDLPYGRQIGVGVNGNLLG